MVDRDDWSGVVFGRGNPDAAIIIEVPLNPSPTGGSGAFLALASDDRRWWVKPQNNLQGQRVIVTEHVVGAAGALIGAPVCDVAVVQIPEELAGWEFRPGARLEPGFAHAALAVDDVQEVRALDYRYRDENRQRHVGVFALYDWCWGGDDQWLYSETEDRKLYSHDHGWYLPGAPEWTESTLLAQVDEPHPAGYSTSDLDPAELGRMSDRLEAPLRDPLAHLLQAVPAAWPVTESELEVLGFFLERRAPAVAGRLGAMIGGSP